MDRRKFLVGLGGTALGGSALIGTGAFSRIEAQRGVTIAVAEDPDAYLGLDKCDTPNGSYVDFDNGHLQVLMNPENPTVGESPLGEGINSDSLSWFHNVFQICNQGKEDACVWIEDDEDWPRVNDDELDGDYSDYDGDRRVEFYLGDDEERSVIGSDNAIQLPLGECVCVGIKTNSKGLSDSDELLLLLDNEIRIIADVDGDCFERLPECPFYGTSRDDPTAIFSIQYDPGSDDIIETQVGDIPDDFSNSNYPNGVAFDDDNDVWYFAEMDGTLKTMNEDGSLGIETYGSITPDGEPIAGAAFFDGLYYFIPNGGDTLMTADISGGSADTNTVTSLDWSDIGLGDLAIDRDAEILYVSTVSSSDGALFFTVDLNNLSDQQLVADGESDEFAVGKQIAFADGTLWAHSANGGQWYTVDVSDGSLSDEVATTQEYTDLAQCGFAEWTEPE